MQRQRTCWIRLLVVSSILCCLSVGSVAAVQVGDKAPDFALPATTADEVKLSDYLGKKHVVLFFYNAAFGGA